VQLPHDAAQDLAVVPPRLAAPARDRQQRLHAGKCLVGELEHHARSWPVCFQDRDAIGQQCHQQPSAAVVLVHHADVVALKGDSHRLRNRDLGRVPAATTNDEP
jgi:hypothetical protein